MKIFVELQMIEICDDSTIYMNEVQKLIGSETAGAARVRKHRENKNQNELPAPKTNAERQRSFRAKKSCEEKQHIPFIEDYINKTRYSGNYYVVIKRDKYKCAVCGSIENLCVHHIDGYDEHKPQNNAENKMVTLCRHCHSVTHAGTPLPSDVLDSIDYYIESNEMLPCNADVIKSNTEIEKDIDIDTELDTDKRDKINYQMIVDMYNDICISYPRVISLSDARKKAIKARLKKYTVEQFEEVFTLAEASDFLKGANNRDWQANFDWLIKDANFAKVLDGNYENPAKPITAEQAKDIIQKSRAAAQKFSRSQLERNVTDSWDNKPEPKTAADDPNIQARVEALQKELKGGAE
jgi:hypothetical protein